MDESGVTIENEIVDRSEVTGTRRNCWDRQEWPSFQALGEPEHCVKPQCEKEEDEGGQLSEEKTRGVAAGERNKYSSARKGG